jgi:hypothetical protein
VPKDVIVVVLMPHAYTDTRAYTDTLIQRHTHTHRHTTIHTHRHTHTHTRGLVYNKAVQQITVLDSVGRALFCVSSLS